MLSNSIILDTSIIIDYLRQKQKANTRLYQLAKDKKYSLYISLVTHTELYAGKNVWKNKLAQKELKILLSGLKIINLNQKISQKAGQLKAHNNLDLIDCLIATTALIYKLPLATLNLKHFQKILT